MLLRMVETSLNSYAIWTYLKKQCSFLCLRPFNQEDVKRSTLSKWRQKKRKAVLGMVQVDFFDDRLWRHFLFGLTLNHKSLTCVNVNRVKFGVSKIKSNPFWILQQKDFRLAMKLIPDMKYSLAFISVVYVCLMDVEKSYGDLLSVSMSCCFQAITQ